VSPVKPIVVRPRKVITSGLSSTPARPGNTVSAIDNIANNVAEEARRNQDLIDQRAIESMYDEQPFVDGNEFIEGDPFGGFYRAKGGTSEPFTQGPKPELGSSAGDTIGDTATDAEKLNWLKRHPMATSIGMNSAFGLGSLAPGWADRTDPDNTNSRLHNAADIIGGASAIGLGAGAGKMVFRGINNVPRSFGSATLRNKALRIGAGGAMGVGAYMGAKNIIDANASTPQAPAEAQMAAIDQAAQDAIDMIKEFYGGSDGVAAAIAAGDAALIQQLAAIDAQYAQGMQAVQANYDAALADIQGYANSADQMMQEVAAAQQADYAAAAGGLANYAPTLESQAQQSEVEDQLELPS
jgi:hypothetical protein